MFVILFQYLLNFHFCHHKQAALNKFEKIVDIVSTLPNKKGVRYDDIPVSVLKLSIVHLANTIFKIINYSFLAGIFPDGLKIAKVCPIFKDGEKNVFTNYKPISVLPCFSKKFEKQFIIGSGYFLKVCVPYTY